jgi:ABC-2 type transport system permease protein
MGFPARYFHLFLAFVRFGLTTELSFRANFLVKLLVEVLWLGILLVFYLVLFEQTKAIAGWDQNQYLFFIGCHYTLSAVIETLFLENCVDFANLVRSGDLDLYLLKPIDEQFLITSRKIDWSTAPSILQGAGVMLFALYGMDWTFQPFRLLAFLVMFLCGISLTYGFLLILASSSVWLVRNQSLMEMWWMFTTLMRYPREIFYVSWAQPIGVFFTFVIPVLLVINVPSRTMVKALEPSFIAWTLLCTVVVLVVSRLFFRRALRAYRSASS